MRVSPWRSVIGPKRRDPNGTTQVGLRAGTTERKAVDHPVLDHEGAWTEDAYLALGPATPSGGGRVELVDGTLLVGPAVTAERGRVLTAVRSVVAAALPDGLRVVGPVALRLGPDCVLVPDLVITRTVDPPPIDPAGSPNGAAATESTGVEVLDAADALMVVEVVGREHGATNRSFKPQLYARSRIPYSVLLDHDQPFAVADMIISGRYHEYARAAEGATLHLEDPFPLRIDLAQVCAVASTPGQ